MNTPTDTNPENKQEYMKSMSGCLWEVLAGIVVLIILASVIL